MSKELTPLEAFRIIKYNASECDLFDCNKLYDIIETALKNQVNLELENKTLQMNIDLGVALAKGLRKKLDENNKKLKALEIIKEKEVDVALLNNCNSLEEYNKCLLRDYLYDTEAVEQHLLIQEEYDLLKEVLL